MTVTDAMIVAGGRGTRLQPLTYTTRKELLPFCGLPFLAGVIARLAAAGIQRVHLVVGARTDVFDVLRPHAEAAGVALRLVPEPQPLDTAGGVRAAAEQLDAPFLVLNGDVLTDLDYAAVGAAHERAGAAATIVLTRVADTSSYGVCVRDGSRITRFVEKPPPGTLPGHDTINAGTYVLEPAAIRRFPRGRLSFERTVFPGLLEAGAHLEGVVWDGVWADLGTPERFLAGHRLALAGELDWPLPVERRGDGLHVAAGATIDPAATLHPPVLVLAGARVAAGASVGPCAVLGTGATVAAGASVRDSVLFEHVAIGADVRLREVIAGSGARIDAGADVGVGAVLGDGERVAPGTVVTERERRPPATG